MRSVSIVPVEKKTLFLGFIGNILEHYDSALFGLLTPFIAPLFFYEQDAATALFLTYAIAIFGIITRPLGAFCFGLIGDRLGRRTSLYFSLLGMAFSTAAIGYLPVRVPSAPILLTLLRMLQNFFAAGETVGGALLVLESSPRDKRSFISSLFDASSILGMLLASTAIAVLSHMDSIESCWRYLFWGGAFTGGIGCFFRFWMPVLPQGKSPSYLWRDFWALRKPFLIIILAAGYSYTTYVFSFTFMNGYIPLVTSYAKSDMIAMNTGLLCLDLFLLPLCGYFSMRKKEWIMIYSALVMAVLAVPIFHFLTTSLTNILFVRMAIVSLGIAFSAPYHAWALEQIPFPYRSTILCLGYTLGVQLIGATAPSASIWLYKWTGWVAAPGFYLMFTALCASLAVYVAYRAQLVETPQKPKVSS